jgi:hypothetical protein
MISVVYSRTSSLCLQLQCVYAHVTHWKYARICVRVDQCVTALRAVQMPQAAFSDPARNALVQINVFPRACVAISAALQSRS